MNYSNSDCRIRRITPASRQTKTKPRAPRDSSGARASKSRHVLIAVRHALPVFAVLALTTSASALNITGFAAPDAWLRGGANTTYYGWDVFEGGPILLADTTPDINPYAISGVSIVQNNTEGFPIVRSSTNLYSGPGVTDTFDLTATVKTDGIAASGFTAVLIQLAGSSFGPGQTPAQFDAGSFLINGQLPNYITDGYGTDNRNLWWMEWTLPGNQPSYALEMDAQFSSGSLSKITIDSAWHSTAALDNSNVSIVPEPTAAALLAATGLLGLGRRRRAVR